MVTNLREVSAEVAAKDVQQAIDDGVARTPPADIATAVQRAMWQPVYPRLKIV